MAAVILGAYDFTGGRLKGWNRDPEQDEFERKQHIRQNRRRPIEETIAEVGEGRGRVAISRDRDLMLIVLQVFSLQVTKRGGGRESRPHMELISQTAHFKLFPFPIP